MRSQSNRMDLPILKYGTNPSFIQLSTHLVDFPSFWATALLLRRVDWSCSFDVAGCAPTGLEVALFVMRSIKAQFVAFVHGAEMVSDFNPSKPTQSAVGS